MAREGMWDHRKTAAYLGITERALYWLNHVGKGPRRYRVGRECRYRPAEVDEWLNQQRVVTDR
jgi:predicted DNA-binding transcriptional regulator AlpA